MKNLTENTSSNFTKVSPLIFIGDFITDYPRSTKTPSYADRIASDIRFEEKLKKLYEQTQRMKVGKN